jgi:psiF repeat
MKFVVSAILVFGLTASAFAQTASAPPAAQDNPATAAASGKRSACQAAAQGTKGQERQDQMQLCMAQAHLDCLKQAIDQKMVGPQRKDFMKTCVGGG